MEIKVRISSDERAQDTWAGLQYEYGHDLDGVLQDNNPFKADECEAAEFVVDDVGRAYYRPVNSQPFVRGKAPLPVLATMLREMGVSPVALKGYPV